MLRQVFIVCVAAWSTWASVSAQQVAPKTTKAYEILQKDSGTWNAVIKTWMTPDFQVNPDVPPMESKGVEVNEMLGQFWAVGEFKSNFAGMPFKGRSMTTYDEAKKQYVGTWVDSMSKHSMKSFGTYDEKTKTLTSRTEGVGQDGKPTVGKSTVVYKDENTRLMTMFEKVDGKFVRSMEITYTRKK